MCAGKTGTTEAATRGVRSAEARGPDRGRSLTDFVVAAASAAARKTIEETAIIRLSVKDQQRVAEALINPPPLTPAMKRAFKRHRRLFGPTDGGV